MKQSIELTEESISEALTLLGISLRERLTEKGRDSFINFHEILGATEVEVSELRHAVHLKDPLLVADELLDVAVGCVVGVASMRGYAKLAEAKKTAQGGKAS